MESEESRTFVQKILAAVGMFVGINLASGFLIFLLIITLGAIYHEGVIDFLYLGAPLGLICALNLAVCVWKGELSFHSLISTVILVLAYLISLFLIAGIIIFLKTPSSTWMQQHMQGVFISLILAFVGYPIFQYKTLRHLSGVWRHLALLPLLFMALAAFVSFIFGNMVIFFLTPPFALIYLAILFFSHKLVGSKNVR